LSKPLFSILLAPKKKWAKAHFVLPGNLITI